MRVVSPGCGVWAAMAWRSIERMASVAAGWWCGGSDSMWWRMSIDFGMLRALRMSVNM